MPVRAAADILVRINGDTKDLRQALKESDRGVKGLSSTMKGALIGGGFAAAGLAAVAFADTALAEAGRVRNAYGRLAGTLGHTVAMELKAGAEGFEEWGLSRQDALEQQGYFADVAASLGVANDAIGDFAPEALEAAAAVSRLTGLDTADTIDAIAKAATLGEDDLAKLGIKLSEAEVEARALKDTGKLTAESLTDGETAAAAYKLILEKLAPKIDAARDAQDKLGASSEVVQAKLETLTGKIGEHLTTALDPFLTWALESVDTLEKVHSVMDKTPPSADIMGQAFKNLTRGPLGSTLQTLEDILGAIGLINKTPITVKYNSTPNPDRRESFEGAVIGVIRDYARRNNLTIL